MKNTVKLDQEDQKLLRLIQQDNRMSVDQLAEKCTVSPSSAHRRLARMRAQGIIAAEIAVIEPKSVGLRMTFIVELSLEKVRVNEVAAIKARLKKAAEIQQIYNVTGDADLLLIILARDVEHYEQISRTYFAGDPHVRRYRTSVVMDRVKVTLAVPVDMNESD